jgi:hypothetical protein
MKPTKPFLYTVAALVALGAAVVIPAKTAPVASAQESMPLSTKLTPAMIDYFALDDAFARPTIEALMQCSATPACSASDSSRLRFLDASGAVAASYDAMPGSAIEHVRLRQSARTSDVTETRTLVRRYATDAQGRLVMNGTDSIVKIDLGSGSRASSTLTRVHRYSDVRYLVQDTTYVYPLTGLVVLDLSIVNGPMPHAPLRTASHAAVSFDGTGYAHVLTTNGLSHRVNLKAKLLETIVPDR